MAGSLLSEQTKSKFEKPPKNRKKRVYTTEKWIRATLGDRS